MQQSLSSCRSKLVHTSHVWQVTLQFWTSLVLPIFPVILKTQQLPKNNDFLFKEEKKENERMWSFVFYIWSGNKLHWLNARRRIMQSPIRLACIFSQDDRLSLLATDGLWQLTTLTVMPVHDFICVTLHVTAAFFLFACRNYSPFQELQKNRGFPCQSQKPKTALQALEKQNCWNIVVCLGL